MKPSRDASALAASLRLAAAQPLQGPTNIVQLAPETATEMVEETINSEASIPPKRAKVKAKIAVDRTPISLKPATSLLHDYIIEAAERTKVAGKVIYAQDVMLEVLEKHRPKVRK